MILLLFSCNLTVSQRT